jgi:tetratricopeptide (TPR) repeat protein
MGQIYLIEKNNSAALSETQTSVKLKPSVDAYMQMGQIDRDQANNSAAIQAYEQAIALGPPSAPLVAVIGNVYMAEGDMPKAISEFQRALSIDPNFAVAANNLAWIYAEQGQNLDIALGLAQKAKSEQPDIPSFSDTLAWVMFRRGEYAGALPLLQDCVKRAPDSAQFHYHLGMVLVADGQKAEGKAQLQAALQMKLDSADAEQARKALSQ